MVFSWSPSLEMGAQGIRQWELPHPQGIRQLPPHVSDTSPSETSLVTTIQTRFKLQTNDADSAMAFPTSGVISQFLTNGQVYRAPFPAMAPLHLSRRPILTQRRGNADFLSEKV